MPKKDGKIPRKKGRIPRKKGRIPRREGYQGRKEIYIKEDRRIPMCFYKCIYIYINAIQQNQYIPIIYVYVRTSHLDLRFRVLLLTVFFVLFLPPSFFLF